MVYICTKFGIANYDEYLLVYDIDADDGNNSTKTATLRRVIYEKIRLKFRGFFFMFHRIDHFNERIKKWKN
jgi:hypothetical protein